MFLILLAISIASSELVALCPKDKKFLTLTYEILPYGNPGFLGIYGKAKFITLSGDNPKMSSLKQSFAIFSEYKKYSKAKLALLAQKAGAVGVIFIAFSDNWDLNSVPDDKLDANSISIACLALQRSDLKKLEILQGNVWMKFKRYIYPRVQPIIDLFLIGDNQKDRQFIKVLTDLSNKHNLKVQDFAIYYPNFNLGNQTSSNNCLITQKSNICMNSIGNISGKERVMISILILKAFDTSTILTPFLQGLALAYYNCNNDYSFECMSNELNIDPITGTDIEKFSRGFSGQYNESYAYLNGYLKIYWLNYIETAYCLGFTVAPTSCTPCNDECTNDKLQNKNCDQACNVDSCSYDNLKCLELKNGCQIFYLGDGQCDDNLCQDDPDCNGSSKDDSKLLIILLPFFSGILLTCLVLFIWWKRRKIIICCKDLFKKNSETINIDIVNEQEEKQSVKFINPVDCDVETPRLSHGKDSTTKTGILEQNSENKEKSPKIILGRAKDYNGEYFNEEWVAALEDDCRKLTHKEIAEKYDLNNLVPIEYDGIANIRGKPICVIDPENPIRVGERVIILPCRHIFHLTCLKFWSESRKSFENTCPNCIFPLVNIRL